LRSPKASEGSGGALGEAEALKRGNSVGVRDQIMDLVSDQGLPVTRQERNLLPTPVTTDGKPVDVANQVVTRNSLSLQSITAILDMPEETWERTDLSGNKNRQVGESAKRRQALLPTPSVAHIRNHDEPIEDYLDRRAKAESGEYRGMPGVSLGVAVRMSWGKFEPAIRRWEEILGREAPAPTKPDGKNNSHRLAAEFVEWMMGLPEGWVTDPELGLKRNDQLKALGNGVVPQQAKYALQLLLDDEVLEKIRK
jgi:DNA (cytosine-5)-methyltransferase 1